MTQNASTASNALWSWESFLLGGGSILTCLACWAFVDKSLSVLTMSQLAFSLAFAVNHPHFLSSYVMLYHDFSRHILKQPRYFWAAIVVPLVLVSFIAYSMTQGRADWLGHSINLMYFLVGWHYVKQVFGCMIVTSVQRRIFYSLWERRLILGNLLALWAISFLQSQTTSPAFMFYGITYAGLQLNVAWLYAAQAFLVGTTIAVLGLHLRKFIEQDIKPSVPGLMAWASLYVWYLPAFSHPAFAYLIPFFHSLQYLALVWMFKRNQVAAHVAHLKGPEQRKLWVIKFIGYFATATVLGALAFEFIPKGLDREGLLQNPALGTAPFLAAFLIFINIHHYFIDNVLWRSSNEEIRAHLFGAAPVKPISLPSKSKTAA